MQPSEVKEEAGEEEDQFLKELEEENKLLEEELKQLQEVKGQAVFMPRQQ